MIVELINQHSDRLTGVGLHFLWQGTAIAILAASVSHFLITSPRNRSAIHLLGLAALALCVPVTWMMLKEAPAATVLQPVISQPVSQEMTPPPTIESNVPVPVAQSPLPLSVWIVATYLIGLALMLLRVIRGYRWSHRIRKNGTPVTEALWIQSLTQALATMKLRAKPVMIWSEKITTPVVTGILRPMIVLPVSLMSGLPPAQATAILSHELAHLRRFDHLIVVAQRLLEALFFFHPAVWFLSRRLDQEREKACDDLVLKAGHQRADYAEALVTLASENQPALALAAAKNNHLKERIFRILHHPQPTTVRVNRGGWLVIAAAIFAFGFISLTPANSEEKEVVEEEKSEEPKTGKAAILEKLEIPIPEINFQNASLEEAVEFLRMRSIELDLTSKGRKKGINWVVRSLGNNKIKIDTLVGKDLTFKDVLETICQKTKTRYKVDDFAVTILRQLAPGEEETSFVQRRWKTLPHFPALIAATGIGPKSKSIVGHLEALGVEFPEGAAASYLSSSSSLIVRNTPKNLEMIDAIIKATSDPKTAKGQRARAKSSEAERIASEAHDKLLAQRQWITTPDFLDRIGLVEGSRPSSTEGCLKIHGVTFFGNSGASFVKESSTLIVRNTRENLELIDALVKAAKDPEFGKKRQEAHDAAKKDIEELQKIIIPEIQLQAATLAEAVEFLRVRSAELDPTKKGVKINILGDENDPSHNKIINLHIRKIPLIEIIQIICDATETRYTVEGRNISIIPKDDAPGASVEEPVEEIKKPKLAEIVQRQWTTPPDFIKSISAEGLPPKSRSMVGHLEALGVAFPEGASAALLKTSRTLIVENTLGNHKLIDQIVKDSADPELAERLRARAYDGREERHALEEQAKRVVQRKWTTPADFLTGPDSRKPDGTRKSTMKYLEELGVTFVGGASAAFVRTRQLLIVRNTPANLELVDQIVLSASNPQEAKEELKAAKEARQKNIEELFKIQIAVDFNNTTLQEAVEFLRRESLKNDPAKKGVTISIFANSENRNPSQVLVKSLKMKKSPLLETLSYICYATKTEYQIEGRNISIFPVKE